jgi:asparagine synthase (glutamine-hydrolysing)
LAISWLDQTAISFGGDMCGISGFWDFERSASPEELAHISSRMKDSLSHRGPDSSGIWTDAEQGLALGHRRLSVIDLSVEGHQPMLSADERFVLIYNGEIYNHAELREQLKGTGCRFRGHSDTEVLLEAIARWGLRETIGRINGMFAFAVWDRRDRKLSLVRDRVGIKPMYYGWSGSVFLFASELKAFKQHLRFRPEIDRNVLALFMENGYIPSPSSIYREVFKLPPGHLLEIPATSDPDRAKPECYWSLKQIAQEAGHRSMVKNPAELLEALAERVRESVRMRLVADVPVGTFLSGGIDSSLVTAMAGAEADPSIRTFTIGFQEAAYDESPFAKEVAHRLGVEQMVQIVSPAEALEVIPRLPAIYDEPFADSSQIPTFLISQLARRHVIVCLSGDGGDELFGGYHRYQHIHRIRNKLLCCPRAIRKPLASLYDLVKNRWMKGQTEPGLAARIAAAGSDRELYSLLNRHWPAGSRVVIGGETAGTEFHPDSYWIGSGSFLENMMAYDSLTYLPEDILCKLDRASMSLGLEVRVPLLDHRIVELAWSMPLEQKLSGGVGKRPLRQILSRFLPAELFDRPKTGFGIPVGQWLRGPLRDWAEELLSAERLEREGWLQPGPIREKWEQHQTGKWDWQYLLWNVLMFQAWLQESA